MNAPARNDEALREQGDEAKQESKFSRNDTSTENQRQIILEALRTGPKDTIALRGNYGVLMPAPRIGELKHRFGYNIETVRVTRHTQDGVLHSRIALYVLHPPVDLFGEVMQ
jgi:hypothetical protein